MIDSTYAYVLFLGGMVYSGEGLGSTLNYLGSRSIDIDTKYHRPRVCYSCMCHVDTLCFCFFAVIALYLRCMF